MSKSAFKIVRTATLKPDDADRDAATVSTRDGAPCIKPITCTTGPTLDVGGHRGVTMDTINDTARRILAVLDAADACGEHGLSLGNHDATADEKRLLDRLATMCPGLVFIYTSDGAPCNSAGIMSPRGSSLVFYRAFPACYTPSRAYSSGADRAAYLALVALAEATTAEAQHAAFPETR